MPKEIQPLDYYIGRPAYQQTLEFVSAGANNMLEKIRLGQLPERTIPEGLTPDLSNLPFQAELTRREEMAWLKAIHTWQVVDWTYQILSRDPSLFDGQHQVHTNGEEIDAFEVALVAALDHDANRFEQALWGSFSDSHTFDHADIAAIEYIYRAPQVFPPKIMWRISEATRQHNKKVTDDKHPLTLLIRDADKLAILDEIEFLLLWENGHKLKQQSTISDEVVEGFLADELVGNGQIISTADKVTSRLAWIYDLNFQAPKQLFLERDIPNRLLKILEPMVSQEQYQLIANKVAETTQSWYLQADLGPRTNSRKLTADN